MNRSFGPRSAFGTRIGAAIPFAHETNGKRPQLAGRLLEKTLIKRLRE